MSTLGPKSGGSIVVAVGRGIVVSLTLAAAWSFGVDLNHQYR
jgi:hypothetical protein